jgi:hypothetical protein
MLNNSAEVTETISACAQIVEQYADTIPELWAVVAALRSCEDWMDATAEAEAGLLSD